MFVLENLYLDLTSNKLCPLVLVPMWTVFTPQCWTSFFRILCQYHCHSLHQPNGWLIPCASQSSFRGLAMFQREISLAAQHIPGIYNHAADRESRVDRFVRLETRPNCLCSPQRPVGSIRGGFVRETVNKSASQLCELETRSRGGSDRRSLRIGLRSGVTHSPFQSGRSLPIPSARTGYPVPVSRSPSMGDAALVSSTVTSECRISTPLPNRPKGSKQGGITSPSPQASTSKGGLSHPMLHCNGNFKPGSGTHCFRLS